MTTWTLVPDELAVDLVTEHLHGVVLPCRRVTRPEHAELGVDSDYIYWRLLDLWPAGRMDHARWNELGLDGTRHVHRFVDVPPGIRLRTVAPVRWLRVERADHPSFGF